MKPAVFIDRDGVLNHNDKSKPGGPKYVLKWDDWEWIDGAIEGFRLISQSDYLPIVISNQMCVGAGLANYKTIQYIFSHMAFDLMRQSCDGVYYFCPHHWQDRCVCRKPKPGLIFHAAIEHEINLHNSWMIGDSQSDMTAGWNAGIRNLIKICDEEQPRFFTRNTPRGYPLPNLLEAVKFILGRTKQ